MDSSWTTGEKWLPDNPVDLESLFTRDKLVKKEKKQWIEIVKSD